MTISIPNHFIAIHLNYESVNNWHKQYSSKITHKLHTYLHTQTSKHRLICTPWLSIEKLMWKYKPYLPEPKVQHELWFSCNISSVNGCKHQQSFIITVFTITFSNIQSHASIPDPWKWVLWPFIQTHRPSGALNVKYPADYLHHSDYLCFSQI